MKKFWLAILVTCAALIVVYGAAFAQDPTPVPDDAVNAIAKQLYCPVCENTPLDVCPTQACIEWRELIRDMLAQGKTEAQIKQYFVDRFGDRVLAAPPARGLNWLVYIIPPIAILAGVFLLWRAFRSWRQSAPAAAPGAPPGASADGHSADDEKYIERLEEELRKL
jgi:cytochrome c-type biogenesis protein CcmH